VNKYHFVSIFDNMDSPRYEVSRASWDLNNIEQIEIHDSAHRRLCNDTYRKLPYVKDIINKGIEQIDPKINFIILLTNSDSCLLPSIEKLLDGVNDNTSLVLSRRDVLEDFDKPLTGEELTNCPGYQGKDGFAFTKNFWLKNRDEFLDTVYGAEFWDYLFYLQLKINSKLIRDSECLYHRAHENSWSNICYRVLVKSQLHNIQLAKNFLYRNYDQIDYKDLFKEWEEGIFKNAMLLNLDQILEENSNITGVIHIGGHIGHENWIYEKHKIPNVLYYEPNPVIFKDLVYIADSAKCVNKALGNVSGKIEMYVETANGGMSNSILKPKLHLEKYPHIEFSEKITVDIEKLDNENFDRSLYNFLNIDTQGYELEVLKGATNTLKNIIGIIIEVNLVEMYEGNGNFYEIREFLEKHNFVQEKIALVDDQTWGEAYFKKI
jgi:FkbM family methyltransferase